APPDPTVTFKLPGPPPATGDNSHSRERPQGPSGARPVLKQGPVAVRPSHRPVVATTTPVPGRRVVVGSAHSSRRKPPSPRHPVPRTKPSAVPPRKPPAV